MPPQTNLNHTRLSWNAVAELAIVLNSEEILNLSTAFARARTLEKPLFSIESARLELLEVTLRCFLLAHAGVAEWQTQGTQNPPLFTGLRVRLPPPAPSDRARKPNASLVPEEEAPSSGPIG